jgi:hypothetical protein
VSKANLKAGQTQNDEDDAKPLLRELFAKKLPGINNEIRKRLASTTTS